MKCLNCISLLNDSCMHHALIKGMKIEHENVGIKEKIMADLI